MKDILISVSISDPFVSKDCPTSSCVEVRVNALTFGSAPIVSRGTYVLPPVTHTFPKYERWMISSEVDKVLNLINK